jgi:hypothetical protein
MLARLEGSVSTRWLLENGRRGRHENPGASAAPSGQLNPRTERKNRGEHVSTRQADALPADILGSKEVKP